MFNFFLKVQENILGGMCDWLLEVVCMIYFKKYVEDIFVYFIFAK